jgi:hypothetical protein
LLHLYLKVDVLFKGCVYLVGCELCEPLLEKVDAELDIEVFLLEIIDVLGMISVSMPTRGMR